MSGDAWEHIRNLDETENWHERNVIISRSDHQAYTDWARVGNILTSVVRPSVSLPRRKWWMIWWTVYRDRGEFYMCCVHLLEGCG